MKVIVKAPLLSATGYGTHSRQVFRYCIEKGWDTTAAIVPWGICTYMIDPDAEGGLIGKIMESSSPFPENAKADLSFQVRLPNEWEPNLANFNVGVTAGVETDVCSPEWVECCKKMDLVIVPSQHTAKTFIASGVSQDKIKVVSEALSSAVPSKDFRLEVSTKFNFLLFGQLTHSQPELDRKNTFFAIKWLVEEFKDDPDVGIIIKTNNGRFTTIDRKLTLGLFKNLISQVRKGPYPKFYLSHGYLKDDEVSAVYRDPAIKALVAPTRGEGFGLTILEAAAAGLPVIATNWSGHLDFMKHVRFLPIDFDLQDIPEERVDGNVFIKGSKWAQPKEESFKEKVRKFRKGSNLPKKWAQEGAEKVKEKFSFEEISKQYDIAMEKHCHSNSHFTHFFS